MTKTMTKTHVISKLPSYGIEYNVVPTLEEMFTAYSYIKLLSTLNKIDLTIKQIRKNAPSKKVMLFLTKEEKEKLADILEKITKRYIDYENLDQDIPMFVYNIIRKYVNIRYFSFLPYTNIVSILCITFAHPFIIYTSRNISCNYQYWRNMLIPIKISDTKFRKTLIGKRFYTSMFMSFFIDPKFVTEKMFRMRIRQFYNHSKVEEWFNTTIERELKSINKKLNKNYKTLDELEKQYRKQVLLRCFRDLLRIYLFNTFAVSVYFYKKYRLDRDKIAVDESKIGIKFVDKLKRVQNGHIIQPVDIVNKNSIEQARKLIEDIDSIDVTKLRD